MGDTEEEKFRLIAEIRDRLKYLHETDTIPLVTKIEIARNALAILEGQNPEEPGAL